MKFGGTLWRNIREALGARHDPERVRLLADLYWRTLLVTAFILLVLVFLYGTWGLMRILNDLSVASDTSALPRPPLNRSELNATVRALEARKTQFEVLKANPPAAISDPNI